MSARMIVYRCLETERLGVYTSQGEEEPFCTFVRLTIVWECGHHNRLYPGGL